MLLKSLLYVFSVVILAAVPGIAGLHPSYSERVVIDTLPFYSGGDYDPAVPKPNDYFRYPLGEWPFRYHELVHFLQEIAAHSGRVALEERGETYEGRKLFNVLVGSEENMGRRERIRAQMSTLADPAAVSTETQLDSLVNDLPVIAWLGYTIHGDELSGVEAAALLVYHLAAANDQATLDILKNVFIVIDPLQNPDGRERFVSMLDNYRGRVPNYDRNALQHRGVYPWGRVNHYLFDLNRDAVLLRQQETLSKIETILNWHPQLVVDAHEMGSEGTFLFSPPREPVNYNTPENVMKWLDVFSKDQAAAFDQRGWPYYTGEWSEQWYPGYSSAWVAFLGSVGILYEMAGVDGMFVRQRDNYILTFHEAVNKQFTSSLANLTTAAKNREALLRDYHRTRKEIVAEGRKSGLTFVFVPDDDEMRTKRFIESLIDLGIEVNRASSAFSVSAAHDIYGETHDSKAFPAGSYVVGTAQPNGALAKAVLEFDPRLHLDFLKEERRELEKHDDTRMYETSTWSLPLAYDIEAYWTTTPPKAATEPVTEVALQEGRLHQPDARFGFVVDMVGEKTYLLLNKLFAEDIVVYGSEKPFTIEGRSLRAGALVMRVRGNPDDLRETLRRLSEEVGIDIYGVNTGHSSAGSLLGAPTFILLMEPRIALMTGDGINYLSFGSLWFTIDRELEMPYSLLSLSDLRWIDLSPYNVLVLPSSWGPLASQVDENAAKKLENWVSDGGTLICIRGSAAWAADTAHGISDVRIKQQVLDKLDEYRTGLKRELSAERPEVDTLELWYPEKAPKVVEEEKQAKPDLEKARELDDWQRKFRPNGVFMRVNLDTEHWLAFGMRNKVPAIVSDDHAFMSARPVTTVGRFADGGSLRVSGLLWPEARERLSNTAYLTQEAKGKGQIVIIAGDPNWRAYTYGTRRLFLNAVLYGPGMGCSSEEPYKQ